MHYLSAITLLFYLSTPTTSTTEILINTLKTKGSFNHFWASTGLWYVFFLTGVEEIYSVGIFFSPPDPKNEIYRFLLSKDAKINFALIGALPNQGIQQIRIHWLLFLLKR